MVSQWQSSANSHNWTTPEHPWKTTVIPLEAQWKHTGYQKLFLRWHSSEHWALSSRHTRLPLNYHWLRVRVTKRDDKPYYIVRIFMLICSQPRCLFRTQYRARYSWGESRVLKWTAHIFRLHYGQSPSPLFMCMNVRWYKIKKCRCVCIYKLFVVCPLCLLNLYRNKLRWGKRVMTWVSYTLLTFSDLAMQVVS